jgi:hypothetical protein
MKILLVTTLTFLMTLGQIGARGQTATTDQHVKIRIKNGSKFLITKLTILDNNFENIKPGDTSDYVEVLPFYPSMKVDITIQRSRTFARDLWYHTISYPIDNVGEKLITNDKNTVVITVLKSEEKGQINVNTEIMKN